MLVLVGLFAVFAVLLGLAGLARPSVLVAFGRSFVAGPGVWGGFVMRAVVAVALWVSAPDAATPTTFRVLAVLFGIGAVTLPIVGARRFERNVEWGAKQSPLVLRTMCLFSFALGGFLLWSAFA